MGLDGGTARRTGFVVGTSGCWVAEHALVPKRTPGLPASAGWHLGHLPFSPGWVGHQPGGIPNSAHLKPSPGGPACPDQLFPFFSWSNFSCSDHSHWAHLRLVLLSHTARLI